MNGISAQLNVQRGGFTLAAAFELPSTGVSALFGASGSGKTTCLRALAGLERLPNSRIQVGDEVWQDESEGVFIPPHLREIGYVFQEASLFSHLNVKKNLLFGHNRLTPAQRKVSMDTVVELLGIQNLLKRPPSALSGGERQRVAIARALLTSPKLLLMDEPLSALDLALKQEILPYLENLHQELSIPIIYVSHAADEVARLADHIVLLEKGSVVAEGPLTQVMTDHHSAALFRDGVSTLLEGKISEQLPEQHLTIVSINSLALRLTQRSLKIGSALRCRVYASDVSVSLTQPSDSSILNTFQGQVERIDSTKNPGEVLLTLSIAEQQPLLAQISFHSLKRLNISVGMRLWAQVKSVAVL